MPPKVSRLGLLALLLGIVLLGVQLHFCADLTPATTGTHTCPICTAAVSALSVDSPSIAMAVETTRLQVFHNFSSVPAPTPRATTSRAPPLL